jgi:hypothetical protein
MNAGRLLLRAVLVVGLAAPGWALAKVHRCVDPVTKTVTLSDLECGQDRVPTPAEAAASIEAARVAGIAADARKAAERADRQLVNRFPDEATHRTAQVADLNDVIVNLRVALRRLEQLKVERKPLDEEAKFYVGKPLPPVLKRSIDASEASFAALVDVFHSLETQVAEIVAKFGIERERLLKLWAGTPPGSMGLLAPTAAASASR